MTDTMRRTMKRGLACAALLGLAILCRQSSTAQTEGWKTYDYPADGFSVSLPSQPEVSKQNVDTVLGTIEAHLYEVDDSGVELVVSFNDYGPRAAGADTDSELEGAKNGEIQNLHGHATREAKITLGNYRGLEFEAESDSLHIYARIYVVGTTLYQLVVVSPLGQSYAGTMRFLDSFRLTARTAQ